MLNLDDKKIRYSLIDRLSTLSKAPKAILEELRVHNGNAIADVVTVHKYAHCYEIKGDNDNVHRILKQGRFYDLVFKKITLVTTTRHIENALRLAPEHWGIMCVRENAGKVKISYVRSARPSPDFDKRLALLTLWKSELIDVALSITTGKVEKFNRIQLTDLIALKLDKDTLSKSIGDKLISRHS
ncbi:sce7726 family protein [Methylobacter tundripaludum]|uniref:sce7726 family protein n=1 Tax=Methylobacter tundripaludum TaxID=173365 RepID=UPI0004DF6B17|nr:sce7726 family protein [Methylobacter tundripaludum]